MALAAGITTLQAGKSTQLPMPNFAFQLECAFAKMEFSAVGVTFEYVARKSLGHGCLRDGRKIVGPATD
jgi:hypothetical protein